MYYIKELNSHELGYRNGIPNKAGRYIYVTKSYGDFFPVLSKIVTNDNVLLPLIPPFNDSKVYSTFVYHNDKYNRTGGSRDEYRLYLNEGIDPGHDFFKPKDIVVFERIETTELVPIYKLYRFEQTDQYYGELKQVLSGSKIRGGAHVFVRELPFLHKFIVEEDVLNVVIPGEVIEDVGEQQKEILNFDDEIENIRGANLFNSISFRDFVLYAYGYKCAITGKVIQYRNLSNLEAAHIQPKAQAGTFLPCNGLALCRDMHWAFDKGFITITDDYTILVHNEVKNTELKGLDGKKIFIPKDPYFRPEKKFLKHHRENIFGLFMYSGSIRSGV